jgi:hypothetical protein
MLEENQLYVSVMPWKHRDRPLATKRKSCRSRVQFRREQQVLEELKQEIHFSLALLVFEGVE